MTNLATIKNQARLLVEAVLKQKRTFNETAEIEHRTVKGTVSVTIDGQPFEYDYTASATVATDSWQEERPYGMGVAYEPMGDSEVQDVEIIGVTPLDGGPEEHQLVDAAIIADAKERAIEV